MNWIYHFRNKFYPNIDLQPVFNSFLRPYQIIENEQILVGEKVVQLDILCIEKALELQPTNATVNKIYYEYLDGKEYYLKNIEVTESDQDLYEAKLFCI